MKFLGNQHWLQEQFGPEADSGRRVAGSNRENLSAHPGDAVVGRRIKTRANKNDGKSRSEGQVGGNT